MTMALVDLRTRDDGTALGTNGAGLDITSRRALDWFDAGDEAGFLRGLQEGYRAGYDAGRSDEASAREAVDEASRAAAHRAHAAFLARLTPWDELAERRGEHDRAARQRALLAARGIA